MPAVQLARLPLATVNQQFHRLALELLVVSFLNLLFLHGFSLFTLSFRVRKIRGGSFSPEGLWLKGPEDQRFVGKRFVEVRSGKYLPRYDLMLLFNGFACC